MRTGKRGVAAQRGFSYVLVLAALAIFGIGLAALGESWSSAARRDKENELLEVGAAYVQAIGNYYRRSPGAVQRFPQRLEELVEDGRFVGAVRHLRRQYADPVSRGGSWGLVRAADGGIAGVYSQSSERPLRRMAQLANGLQLAGERYEEWKFVYVPPAVH
jgi:type II secretory pathway pseudopilin PulG